MNKIINYDKFKNIYQRKHIDSLIDAMESHNKHAISEWYSKREQVYNRYIRIYNK